MYYSFHKLLLATLLVITTTAGSALAATPSASRSTSVSLSDRVSGIHVQLPSGWDLLKGEDLSTLAKLLAEPYDPDGTRGLYKKVQAAVSFGKDPSEFRQITIMPLLYSEINYDESIVKKMRDRVPAFFEQQKKELEDSLRSAGSTIVRSSVVMNGCTVAARVNNSFTQEVQIRYTNRGMILIMYFAGGVDNRADQAIKQLSSYLTIKRHVPGVDAPEAQPAPRQVAPQAAPRQVAPQQAAPQQAAPQQAAPQQYQYQVAPQSTPRPQGTPQQAAPQQAAPQQYQYQVAPQSTPRPQGTPQQAAPQGAPRQYQ